SIAETQEGASDETRGRREECRENAGTDNTAKTRDPTASVESSRAAARRVHDFEPRPRRVRAPNKDCSQDAQPLRARRLARPRVRPPRPPDRGEDRARPA